jgi:hypothetical protein
MVDDAYGDVVELLQIAHVQPQKPANPFGKIVRIQAPRPGDHRARFARSGLDLSQVQSGAYLSPPDHHATG